MDSHPEEQHPIGDITGGSTSSLRVYNDEKLCGLDFSVPALKPERPEFEANVQKQNVWIVERSKLMRAALKVLLRGSGFEVTGEASDVDALSIERPSGSLPSLIVVAADPDTEGRTDAALDVERICAAFNVPVVILADRLHLQHLVRSMRAGVSGYVLRDITADALKQSMALVLAGEKVLPSELVDVLIETSSIPGASGNPKAPALSDQERAVLGRLSLGRSNKQIASELGLPDIKVKILLRALFRKIDAENRTDAAIWAMRHGL